MMDDESIDISSGAAWDHHGLLARHGRHAEFQILTNTYGAQFGGYWAP